MAIEAKLLSRYPRRFNVTGGLTKTEQNGVITLGFNYTDTEIGAQLQQAVEASTAQALLAEEYAEDAEEALASMVASLPLVGADGSMLVDEDGERKVKTPAQVRANLNVPAWAELPFVDGAKYGITGNQGEDQTSALQAAIDDLPPEGGTIVWNGICTLQVTDTPVDVTGRRNIRFLGQSTQGAGAEQRSSLFIASGDIGFKNCVINAAKSANVGFQNLFIYTQTDGTFNGNIVNWGSDDPQPGDDAVFPFMLDCTVSVYGTVSSAAIWLWGATNGTFDKVTFSTVGSAGAVFLQFFPADNHLVFCNQHRFSSCQFMPGITAPVRGSGEGITFLACNFQAGSDGVSRAIVGGDGSGEGYVPFRALNIIGCTFYDTTAAGGQWIAVALGEGVNVIGCRAGGHVGGSSFLALGGAEHPSGISSLHGVHGATVVGNSLTDFSVAIHCNGEKAAGTHVKRLKTFGNRYQNVAAVVNSTAQAELWNIEESMFGYPEYADRAAAVSAELPTGSIFVATGNSGHRALEIV